MTKWDISRAELSRLAAASGLTVVGVTSAERFGSAAAYLTEHIAQGHTRGMDWFTIERARQSADPCTLHDTVLSIVSVAVPFWAGHIDPPQDGMLRGRIARYAWGSDYHVTLKRRMRTLVEAIEDEVGHAVEARELTDTARAIDRAIAARAGTGWYGKNSMIIVPGHGSWVMLGELYLDLSLAVDVPLDKHCGRCAICLDRCPTGAIVEPYRVHAPRCISYLTIEERGWIPRTLRPLMGNHVFGCDVCQDVCPYTRAASITADADFLPRSLENAYPSLAWLAMMDEAAFRATFSGTPVTRAKRRGMARNAAVALGNSGDPRAEPVLTTMLTDHDEPLARGHAAVALRQLVGDASLPDLRRAWEAERDPAVRDEIAWALERQEDRGGNDAAAG